MGKKKSKWKRRLDERGILSAPLFSTSSQPSVVVIPLPFQSPSLYVSPRISLFWSIFATQFSRPPASRITIDSLVFPCSLFFFLFQARASFLTPLTMSNVIELIYSFLFSILVPFCKTACEMWNISGTYLIEVSSKKKKRWVISEVVESFGISLPLTNPQPPIPFIFFHFSQSHF